MTDITVQTASLAGTAAQDMSILGLVGHADLVVKLVMLVLFLSSLWSWAIIFDKIVSYRAAKFKIGKFEKRFWSGEPLDRLYDVVKRNPDNVLARIFIAAMEEWQQDSARRRSASDAALRVGVKERIAKAMQVAGGRALEELESRLAFLATVGSAAPFIGLFGTVWGIMNSFQSIAMAKNTTLAVVAPGIAEALLATAVGLFAAIPAVIFYNKFSSDVNRFASKVDEFTGELENILSRELDQK